MISGVSATVAAGLMTERVLASPQPTGPRPEAANPDGSTRLSIPAESFVNGWAYPAIPAGSTIVGADLYFHPAAPISGTDPTVFAELVFKFLGSDLPSGHDLSVTASVRSGVGPFPFAGQAPLDVASNGYVALHVSGDVQYLSGISVAYRTPASASSGSFVAGPVGRLVDTRVGLGGPAIQPGEERLVTLPIATGGHAGVFNLTVTETQGGGWLAVYPAGTAFQMTSSINWLGSNATVATLVISGTDTAKSVVVRGGVNPTHFIVDFVGTLM